MLTSRDAMAARLAAAAALLALGSCGPQYDPLTREGLWTPTRANHANLMLMVANPADLLRGSGTGTSDGQLAAAAVDRLRQDKVKKLPRTDIAKIESGDNDSQPAGAP